MNHFTYSDFQKLTQDEKTLNKLLHSDQNNKTESNMPKTASIYNILSYSKALSVRPSKHIGHLENLRN